MDWINDILFTHSAIQAVIVLSLIIFSGLALGRLKVKGISLGITFVFFTGIFAGYLGLSIDPMMLNYAESSGLVLFVYALGLQVGPGFFSSFRKGGVRLNIVSLLLILTGTAFALLIGFGLRINIADITGVLCGATTNTPALAAAQQTLKQLGLPSTSAALGCAVTYPLGVVGVILAMIVLRKCFVRPVDLEDEKEEDSDQTYIATFIVKNPAVEGHTLKEIRNGNHPIPFIVTRLWRDGKVCLPEPDKVLQTGDRLMVITKEKDVTALTIIFGEKENKDWNRHRINWNALDKNIVSRNILISRSGINGKKLGALRMRSSMGITVSRVLRSGVHLLATPGLRLQLGDRLTVVGPSAAIDRAEKLLGNRVGSLKDPNLAVIFLGLMVGLILGSIPLSFPGSSIPVKLGLAGGPIVAGLLLGCYGPRFHIITYTTRSANLMLRGVGLSFYLACLGLDAGKHFFDTLVGPQGVAWISIGLFLTFVPVLLIGIVAMRCFHLNFGNTCGMLCGGMANPMALTYANTTISGDSPAISYATVYPLGMFVRVIIAQVMILLCA